MRIPTLRSLSFGKSIIESIPAAKYPGLTLYSKIRQQQIKPAANKAAVGVSALRRLMANIGGPKYSRRGVLMNSAQSVLLYGAKVWADALGKQVYRKRLAQVQRAGTSSVASAYRTVSEPAAMVIVGVILVVLLAKERQIIYKCMGDEPREVVAREERHRTPRRVTAFLAKRNYRQMDCAAWRFSVLPA